MQNGLSSIQGPKNEPKITFSFAICRHPVNLGAIVRHRGWVIPKRPYILGGIIGAALLLAGSPDSLAETGPDDPADLDYIGSLEFDPETSSLSAGWTIRVLDQDVRRLNLGLSSRFGRAQVTGPSLSRVKLIPDADGYEDLNHYHIELQPAEQGKPRLIRFAYTGPFLSSPNDIGFNSVSPDKIELTIDSFWFPFETSFSQTVTANLGIRAAGDWIGIADGRMEAVPGGFRLHQDRPGLDIAFALITDAQIHEETDFILYDVRTEPGTKWPELKQALRHCVRDLDGIAGSAHALPPIAVLITDRAMGAYSRGSFISLTDIENETGPSLHRLLCHELAHYWSRANVNGPDDWINEGVADYLALISYRDRFGADAFDNVLEDYRSRLENMVLPPIWTPETAAHPPYHNRYFAAPLTLYQLEQRVGEGAFRSFLSRVIAEEVATTADLFALIETLFGSETAHYYRGLLTH